MVDDRSKPDRMPRKLLDTARMRVLGWRLQIGLRDGLLEVIKEYLPGGLSNMSLMTKPALIVHAGMPKTGTSTIQTASGQTAWADALASRRIRYLSADGIVKNHSRYLDAQVGRPDWAPEVEHIDLVNRFVVALRDFAETLPAGWAGLVSAESLFDIARDISSLSRVASLLRRHFEVVGVPVYVREPLSYASSRVQQGRKNAYPLEACLRNAAVFVSDLMTSIRNLEVVFGADAVRVRSYDRALLDSGEVLRDFAVHMLGLEPSAALEKLIRTHHSGNFSLTNEILEPLVDFYARRGVTPSSIKRRFVARLSNVRWKGRPYRLDKVQAQFMLPIVEAADHSRAALRAYLRYDCFPSFEPNTSGAGPACDRAALAASIENIETLKALIRIEHGAAGEGFDLPMPDSIEQAQARTRELLEVLYDHC